MKKFADEFAKKKKKEKMDYAEMTNAIVNRLIEVKKEFPECEKAQMSVAAYAFLLCTFAEAGLTENEATNALMSLINSKMTSNLFKQFVMQAS